MLRATTLKNAFFMVALCSLILVAAALWSFISSDSGQAAQHNYNQPESIQTMKPPVVADSVKPQKSKWHPPHVVKTWTTRYGGRIFRVTQFPRCEHVETLITYNPAGETVKAAKKRMNGITAAPGSFHNSQSMCLADFLQRGGSVLSRATTGRYFLAIHPDGTLAISRNYAAVKGKAGVSALALGQLLAPLSRDGFSNAFMNKLTDRMAIGLNKNYVFIVQGKSSIWTLSKFIRRTLPVDIAINTDGGHVVRGKAPVHVVFRWR